MNTVRKTIMLDARIVKKGIENGVTRHVRELIFNLIANPENDKFQFIILVCQNSIFLDYEFPPNFIFVKLKYSEFGILGQIEVLFKILKYKPKIFHAPYFIVPLLSKVPLIVTLHDMNHIAFSKHYSLIEKFYYNFLLKRRLLTAKNIITVSNFTKNEIVKNLTISPDKIKVIYNGVVSNFKPLQNFSKEKINSVIFKYKLPQKFIFTVGSNRPHKNLDMLTESYCKGNFRVPLVILSNSYEKLLEIGKYYGKNKNLHFIQYVFEDDFAVLYSLSSAFVNVSLYEGFGLSSLEAAACGVPVVVSNCTALPEIMENAAIYVDPHNILDIQRGINEVLNHNKPNIDKNIQTGFIQAKKYSWELMAKETLSLYDGLQ